MLTDVVEAIEKMCRDIMGGIHTAMPARVVKYYDGRIDAKISGKFYLEGTAYEYPLITGCPVIAGGGIAYPIKEGDACVLLFMEQSLSEWLSGTETNTNEKWSLTNAVAICGLSKDESADQKQANESGAAVVENLQSNGSIKIGDMDVGETIEEIEDDVESLGERVSEIESEVSPATTTSLGTVMIGDDVNVDSSGKISISKPNRNYLMNPFFKVNQRNVSGTVPSNWQYGADRWQSGSNGTYIVGTTSNPDTVYISTSSSGRDTCMQQKIYGFDLWGRALTLSAIIGGSLFRGTLTLPDSAPGESTSYDFYSGSLITLRLYWDASNSKMCCRIMRNTSGSNSITAVKLEIGSVSTLSLDTAPDYAEELEKCKFFFERIDFGSYSPVGNYTRYGDVGEVPFFYSKKRIAPSFTVSGSYLALYTSGAFNTGALSFTLPSKDSAFITFNAGSYANGYVRADGGSSNYIDVSADY